MKKTMPLVLFALLCAAAGASSAAVHIECKQSHGKCVPPPAPPAPPVPPAPPTPPAFAASGAIPALPALPAMPAMPPAPPAPDLPDVSEGAHAACAAKAAGTALIWVIKAGETMTGACQRENGKMVFQLRSYHLD